MRTSKGMLRARWLVCLLAVWSAIFVPGLFSRPQAPGSAEVPVVKGGAGKCSADFVVTDYSGKGLYDAKIRIQLRYGFMGARPGSSLKSARTPMAKPAWKAFPIESGDPRSSRFNAVTRASPCRTTRRPIATRGMKSLSG